MNTSSKPLLPVLLCLATAVVSGCAQPVAQTTPAPTAPAHAQCTALASQPLGNISLDAAEVVADRTDLPAFCSVRGTIAPSIGFEMRLPLAGWNGKLFQSGCGGYCGSVLPDKPGWSNTINGALQMGYAAITTDAGHEGGLGDASWALDNPRGVELYAHRSIPLTHAAGLRLAEAFYGTDPRLSYFGGCSNGGRMGAMAAQRYPDLFDGIFAGGSVLNLSQNGGIYGSWVVQSNTRADGSRIVTAENFAAKLPLLEAEVLQQCDASDGQADGRISQPRNCRPDFRTLPACSGRAGEDTSACFTAEETGVLERWYRGPHNSAGEPLYPGMPPGGERFLLAWFLDRGGQTAPGNALGGDYARYLGFPEGVPAGYTAMDFDFDSDPARLVENGKYLNALDPDLSDFRAQGGKLLMWHGWQDPLVLPDQSVGYFESVAAVAGGTEAAQDYLRLFMIPGQGHCWEMPASQPDRFNPLAVLERWVEQGEAPERLEMTRPETASGEASGPATAVICPYPIDANSCSR